MISHIQNGLLTSYDKYFEEIFIKYDIIPMGGTALGAVRHSGFIPWDDDMDFFITPKSYHIIKGKKSLNFLEPFSLYNSLGMAKAIIPDFTTIENSLKKESINFANIDLMILSEASSYTTAFLKFYIIRIVVILGVINRRFGINFNNKIFYSIAKYILLKETKIKKYGYHAVGRANFRKGIYPYHWFTPNSIIKFNNRKLRCYNGIHEYLTLRYGKNYLEMPKNDVKLKFKTHSLGYKSTKQITLLIDGVGVLWDYFIWETNNELVLNKSVFNFLMDFPGNIIICTNLKKLPTKLNFNFYTTSGEIPKTNIHYFEKLLVKYDLNPNSVIYIEHNINVCNITDSIFKVINWDNRKHKIDKLYFELAQNLYNNF
jgi:lipopolysaccharide cholinephosphotransferase